MSFVHISLPSRAPFFVLLHEVVLLLVEEEEHGALVLGRVAPVDGEAGPALPEHVHQFGSVERTSATVTQS